MKKLSFLLLALIATTVCAQNNVITYTATSKSLSTNPPILPNSNK